MGKPLKVGIRHKRYNRSDPKIYRKAYDSINWRSKAKSARKPADKGN